MEKYHSLHPPQLSSTLYPLHKLFKRTLQPSNHFPVLVIYTKPSIPAVPYLWMGGGNLPDRIVNFLKAASNHASTLSTH